MEGGRPQGEGGQAQRIRQDDQTARSRKSDCNRIRGLRSATQRFGPANRRYRNASSQIGSRATPAGGGRRILLHQERGGSESEGRQTRLHSQSLDQKCRTQTRAEEALVPQRPEMADRMRGPHQRGQATAWAQSLPVQGRDRNETLGWARRDRRQPRQHRPRNGKEVRPVVAASNLTHCKAPAGHPRRDLLCSVPLTTLPKTSILRREVTRLEE